MRRAARVPIFSFRVRVPPLALQRREVEIRLPVQRSPAAAHQRDALGGQRRGAGGLFVAEHFAVDRAGAESRTSAAPRRRQPGRVRPSRLRRRQQ